MKIKLEFVKRTVAGETFLVPIGETVKKYSGLFALNEVGSFLWERLGGAEGKEELIDAVTAEYDVAREDAERDVSAFLDKLRDMEII